MTSLSSFEGSGEDSAHDLESELNHPEDFWDLEDEPGFDASTMVATGNGTEDENAGGSIGTGVLAPGGVSGGGGGTSAVLRTSDSGGSP